MSARTVTLADGRVAREVAADEAGEWYLRVAHGCVEALEAAALLTWRQAEALHAVARLYRAGGGRVAFLHRDGVGDGRDEQAEAGARRELEALLVAVRCAWTRAHLVAIAQTDEWPVGACLTRVQDAADTIADRLRLA
jgi:ferric-dicitrate binding protein FerR (iron transport regulator)